MRNGIIAAIAAIGLGVLSYHMAVATIGLPNEQGFYQVWLGMGSMLSGIGCLVAGVFLLISVCDIDEDF